MNDGSKRSWVDSLRAGVPLALAAAVIVVTAAQAHAADSLLKPVSQALGDEFNLDIGQGGSPAQSGFEHFGGAVSDGASTQTEIYATPTGVGDSLSITLSGNTHYRNYPDITGGAFIGQTNLLKDNILRTGAGTITMTLDTLDAGQYQITTYHHTTSNNGNSLAGSIDITDATRTSEFVTLFDTTGGSATENTSPTAIGTAFFQFTSDGVNPIDLFFTHNGDGGHMAFGGFELLDITPPPPLAPEPSTFILFGVILTLLAGYYYHRRRTARFAA